MGNQAGLIRLACVHNATQVGVERGNQAGLVRLAGVHIRAPGFGLVGGGGGDETADVEFFVYS